MFLTHKLAYAGIVFVLLTTWISGPRPIPPVSKADLTEEVPEVSQPNDVNKMQQILLDKGHYRGKVDGVLGLRTRASIRAYQKAENLPVTGQLDERTAGKLGVTSENREEAGYDNTSGKPSAGITRDKGFRRTSRTPRSTVAPPAISREGSGKTLQAKGDKLND